jgi:Acetyltransferase (GNAT) domain
VSTSLRVVRDEAGVAEIRDAWLSLAPDRVTADPDFYLAALEGDPQIVRPHVVVLEDDAGPRCMAVARLEQLDLPYRIGYRTVFKPRVRSLTVVVAGILGDPDRRSFDLLLDRLRSDLETDGADIVLFRQLPVDSEHFAWASSTGFLSRQHVVQPGVHRELDLPESVDALLQQKSAKTRTKLRALDRRLERDFGPFEVRRFREPGQIDEFFVAARAVGTKTYQHALGVGVADDDANRKRVAVAMERGWFRGYVLYVKGEPAAFWHGELYRGVLRSGTPGFDPAYASYSLGTLLMLRMIDDLCREDGARTLDFGFGDAEYKQRFTSRSREEADVFVFSRTPRGVWLNVMHTLLFRTVGLLRAVARRTGTLGRLKRRSRARLTGEDGGGQR